MRQNPVDAQTNLGDRLNRSSGAVRFTRIAVQDETGKERWDFREGETIRIRMEYQAYEAAPDLWVYFAFVSGSGHEIITNTKQEITPTPLAAGARGVAVLELPQVPLRQGEYYLYFNLISSLGRQYDAVEYQNTSLPPIVITTDTTDPHRVIGYFSLRARVISDLDAPETA
jgi:hypothetical protein